MTSPISNNPGDGANPQDGMDTGGARPADLSRPGALNGLRALEVCDEKGQFCGKLMADNGADLIKIEPLGAKRAAASAPFCTTCPTASAACPSGTTTPPSAASRSTWRRRRVRIFSNGWPLRPTSCSESRRPGYLESLGLGYERLSADNPGLIMCSLTPYGQTGPWRDYIASDITQLAGGGQMASSGYDEVDVPNAPPIAPGGGNAWHIGGNYAYIGLMAALYYRFLTGEGQYIDASIHEACALTTEGAIAIYLSTGEVVQRHTGRHAAPDMSPAIQFPTGDGGWLNTTRSGTNLTPQRLKLLAEWFDQTRHGRRPDRRTVSGPGSYRGGERPHRAGDERLLYELHAAGRLPRRPATGLSLGAIRSMDELVGDDHLTDREFFKEVEHPELGRAFTYPGPAAIYNGSPWRISRRAPLIGEHNAEILQGELGLTSGQLLLLAEGGVI